MSSAWESDGSNSAPSSWSAAIAATELSSVQEGLAWFELTFGLLFLTVATLMTARFYYVRNVFEIHARSPFLVLLNGLSLMGIMGAITAQIAATLDPTIPIEADDIIVGSYFVTFTFYSCFWARILRLGLAFCPRLKRKMPWLMSENLLVFLSLVIGVGSVSIPLYKRSTYSGLFAGLEFAIDQVDELALVQWILLGTTILWIPIVWRIDDLFQISREMFCVVILQLFQNVAGELASEFATEKVSVYINRTNIPLFSATLLFGVIVIEPLRRLTFDPMSKTYPALARAQDRRRQRGLRALKKRRWSKLTESDSQLDSQESLPASGSDAALPRKKSWSYENLAAVPGMAAAFRAFAFRALCQESVLFLEEAKKYQHGDFSMCPPGVERSQVFAFHAMVDRFFADGAMDEINISGGDKKQILELSRSDAQKFSKLDDDHRRAVFGKAYVEIRYMLETNLLGRFMETQEFKDEESRTPLTRARRRKRGGSGGDICFDVENPLGTASNDTRSRSPPDVSPPETC